MPDAEIAFAREVYAACATVGFSSESVLRLKRLLDADGKGTELAELARMVQLASIDWLCRPQPRSGDDP